MRFAAALCAASLLVLLPPALRAEPPVRKITVVGTCILHVVPDEMRWSVRVEIDDATLARAKGRHDTSMGTLLKYVKTLGSAIKDLQTGGIELGKRTWFDKDHPEPPFNCSTQLSFTLTDFSQYAPIADALSKIDGVNVGSVAYASSHEAELRRDALKRALLNAHEKANDLAVTANCYIDRPLNVEEADALDVRPGMYNDTVTTNVGADPGPQTVVPGQISISARLNVTYDLFYK